MITQKRTFHLRKIQQRSCPSDSDCMALLGSCNEGVKTAPWPRLDGNKFDKIQGKKERN